MPKYSRYEFKGSLSRKDFPSGSADGTTKEAAKKLTKAHQKVNKAAQAEAKTEKPSKRKA